MTRAEVLKLQEPSQIWQEMQKNPELRADGEVWLHMTRLTAKINRRVQCKTAHGGRLYIEIKEKEDINLCLRRK